MAYQLYVWEGERPADDAAGGRECREMVCRHLVGDKTAPTARIRAFVDALTAQWSDDADDPASITSPWVWTPLLDDASGPMLLLTLDDDMALIGSVIIASMAEERGLVVYDPQVELLRPVSEATAAEYWKQRYGTGASLN
ncbi:hypothetical protein [Sporichthya polymorpha]|uniref:hypothetical protein n=1 Tax=Sporichthya polymorpha TaxID=35751 RepID=UPI0003763A78|nr:hypothetical protein [Sporichthya polymorpha]